MQRLARRTTARGAPSVVATLWSGSTAVPTSFLGLVIGRWPKAREGAASISSAPTCGYGLWRCHDYASRFSFGNFWRGIHTSAGVFNWTDVDEAVDLHASLGHEISYSIHGCPQWAAQAAFASQPDNYGGTAGGSPPNTLGTRDGYTNVYVDLYDFVKTLVTRYNTDSVRNNGGAKKIGFLECWNEPSYGGYGLTNYFWGTAAELANMARTVKLAARSVDAAITMLGPSFTGAAASYITPFLNASDGSAGFGRDHVDAIAYHPYSARSPGMRDTGPFTQTIAQLDAAIRAAAVAGGLASTFPVHGMEQALSSDPLGTDTLYRWTLTEMAAYVRRISIMQAAYGWKRSTWYTHDGVFFGNPSRNPEVSRALDFVHNNIAGQTLQQVDLLSDGSFRVTRASGIVIA